MDKTGGSFFGGSTEANWSQRRADEVETPREAAISVQERFSPRSFRE
jgi:hypothetical protein